MKKTVLILTITLLISIPNVGRGQALFQGLNQPINARGWGMGSAAASQFNGGSGLLYNPAILPRSPNLWQFNYTTFVLDIYSSTGFVIFKAPIKGKLGLLMQYLDYGSFTERDHSGNETGSFTANDLALRLGYGLQLTHRLSIGASCGYVRSNLNTLSAKALLGSFGLHYFDEDNNLAIGISYHNFGTLLRDYASDDEEVPATFILGISKKLEHLPLIISVDAYEAYQEEYVVKIGGEFLLGKYFFLRWGSSTRRFQIRGQENLKNFFASSATGIGMNVGKIYFDLAFVGLGDTGTISSFSITQIF
jgi:hypothetical protein